MRFKNLSWRRLLPHSANVAAPLFSKLVGLIGYALSVPVFVSHAGAADFGILVLVISISGYLSALDGGVSYAVNQRVARALSSRKPTSTVVASGLGTSVLVASFVCVGGLILEFIGTARRFGLPNGTVVLAACFVAINSINTPAVATLQAHGSLVAANASRAVYEAARGVAVAVAAFATQPVVAALGYIVIAQLLKACIDYAIVSRKLSPPGIPRPRVSAEELRLNSSIGWPAAGSLIVGLVLNGFDKVIVRERFGDTALGVYAIGFDLATKMYAFVWAASAALAPVYQRRYFAGRPIWPVLAVSLGAVCAIVIVYYAPLGLFPEQILSIWLGASHAHAEPYLRIFSLVAILYLLYEAGYVALMSTGHSKAALAAQVIGVVAFAAALAVFPREYGALGVAMSLAAAHLCQLVAAFVLAHKILFRKGEFR